MQCAAFYGHRAWQCIQVPVVCAEKVKFMQRTAFSTNRQLSHNTVFLYLHLLLSGIAYTCISTGLLPLRASDEVSRHSADTTVLAEPDGFCVGMYVEWTHCGFSGFVKMIGPSTSTVLYHCSFALAPCDFPLQASHSQLFPKPKKQEKEGRERGGRKIRMSQCVVSQSAAQCARSEC